MPRLSIALLGPFQVEIGGQAVTDFATDKARALLAYLATEADRPHRRDALAGLLWPDVDQQTARRNLRQALAFLHRALDHGGTPSASDEPFLLATRETIQFNGTSDHELDVAAFLALAAANRAHRHRRLETCPSCICRMERIVALYRGDFLQGFYLDDSTLFEEWASLQREWFHREVVEALSCLTGYAERCGHSREARQYARQQVELEPWREEAHRQLMRFLALDGQRSAALAQYEACRRALWAEFSAEPTAETAALWEQIRHDALVPSLSVRHNLPVPATPFVGREVELAELAELLANPDCRLITLVGPGGIGKTRLALQTATGQVGAFVDGVYLASLAAIDGVGHLVSAIIDALGLTLYDRDARVQLLNYLRDKEMLLCLDNVEQIPDAGAILADLLAHAPRTVFLVTSRERLNLREEWVYQVRGLAYPAQGAGPAACSAVILFRQCALRANRRLAPHEDLEIARICRLVEGMPLAIELAAAWTSAYACGEIAQEVARALDILTSRLHNVPERHRSIRATFEHSWQLLPRLERDLLARLSVFRGGFSDEAAAAVAGSSRPLLANLLDRSLIRWAAPDRYDMHELLRQYAAEKLALDPEVCAHTFQEHACYYAALVGGQRDELRRAKHPAAFDRLANEIENARQAWHASVARRWTAEIERMMDSLYHFMEVRCWYEEGIQLFGEVTAAWGGEGGRQRVVAQALARQGALQRHQGRYQEARACLEQALTILEREDMPLERAFCLANLAHVTRNQEGYRETEELAQRCLALASQIGDEWGRANALFLLGVVRYRNGEIEPAQALLDKGLAAARACQGQRLAVSILNVLGDIACHQGDYVRARLVFVECLESSQRLGDSFNAAVHLNNLGTVLHVLEDYAGARQSYQRSLDICVEIGDRSGQAIALSNLGEVAYIQGMSRQARAYYERGLSIGREIEDRWTIANCLNNLGEIACAQEGPDAAGRHFAEALQIAAGARLVPVLLKVLVSVAACFARHGQAGQAAPLLDVARRHPASEQATRETAERVRVEAGLDPVEAAQVTLEEATAAVLSALKAAGRGVCGSAKL